MRVLANTDNAVRELLNEKIATKQVTQAEAVLLYNTGFHAITTTLGNWRHRNATPEAIEAAIERRKLGARMHRIQAKTETARTRALSELTIAQMYEVIWRGMQEDVAAYQN